MDAGTELLEVTLSALHPVVAASNAAPAPNRGRHHPSLNSPARDPTSSDSDVLSPLNSTSESECSGHARNDIHRSEEQTAVEDSMSTTADMVNGARHFQHSSTVQNVIKMNKSDSSLDMNGSIGSIRVRVPSRMLKEVSSPFAHEHTNTPTPPPALRGRYTLQPDQPSLHPKDRRAKNGARLRPPLVQGVSLKEESSTDDSIVAVSSLSEDRSRQSYARKTLSQLATRNATEGRVIYPVVVEGGVESVQEKSDGKENLQELAAIVASSATAAAIAASQRFIGKETEGEKHSAYQTNAEGAFPTAVTRPTTAPVPRQEGTLHKEVNVAESKLLRELSILRKEVMREVRQDKADITKKLQEIQDGGLVCECKQPPVPLPVAQKLVVREDKSSQADIAEGGSVVEERHVASAPRSMLDSTTQTLSYQPPVDTAEVKKSKMADQGSCLSEEDLLGASRLDERLHQVHQRKERLDLNMLWMERDSEHAALLRLLENPALADVHAKLNTLQSQISDDKENDTMAVNGLKSVPAEKQLKSKGRRSKVSPSKLTQARLLVENPKSGKRVAPRPHALYTPRHTPLFSTPVVQGEREWAPSAVASHQHLQPSHPAKRGSQVQFLGSKGGAAASPVHVALPLGRPRIMPSNAVHHGPPPQAASTETLTRPLPLPPKPSTMAPHSRFQSEVLPPVDISTDSSEVGNHTAAQEHLAKGFAVKDTDVQLTLSPLQGNKADVTEYNEFCNFVEVGSIDQSSSEVSANEYLSIPGQQVWVTPTWTPQKQHVKSIHQVTPEGMGVGVVRDKISQMMSANLAQRVQDELLARLWAGQREKSTVVDPIETGSQRSCSTCGRPGGGKGMEETQVPAHLPGGDEMQFLADHQSPVDDRLVRQLVADAILDAAQRHVHMAQAEEKHAEVETASGDGQEYSADFESTTTTSMASVPSTPSTPRETPPLAGGARAEGVEKEEEEEEEEEEVADEPATVALVATPRPTSEEEEEEEEGEETTHSESSTGRISPADTPLLTGEEDVEDDAGQGLITPHGAVEPPKHVTTPVQSPHLLAAEEPPFPSPTRSTITAPSPHKGKPPVEEIHEVTLSESASSVSTKREPSVSASSSSTDHEVSLGEYLLGPIGRARRANDITLSEGEVPLSPGDTEWCAQYAQKLGKLTAPGERRELEWSATFSTSSASDDTTLKEADHSEGEVRRRRQVKKPFQNIPSHLNISTPTDSSTPGQDASSSTDDSRLSLRSDPFPTPSFRRAGPGLLRTHKLPPASKQTRPPVSEDVSVGEVVPPVSTGHHSIGELSSGIRVLLDPPDKQTRHTSTVSPGEIAASGRMGHRRTINGVDVITVGPAHQRRRHHLQSAPDSSVSVGEVVRSRDETLASLDSTVELAHSDRMGGVTSRAVDGQRQSTMRRPEVSGDNEEAEKTPSEEEIQTEYQTDTFTSVGLTQESSDFPVHHLTNGLQLKFAGGLRVEERGGGVEGRAVTKEGETKERQVENGDAKEGGELKGRADIEEGILQDGSSSQLPSEYQDDTFQLSTTPHLESTNEQNGSKGEEASTLEEEEKQEKADPSQTDDFILTVSGSDTTTLSF